MGTTLLDHLLSFTKKPVEPSRPLARALADLEIQPFDERSVETYKTAKKNLVFDEKLATMNRARHEQYAGQWYEERYGVAWSLTSAAATIEEDGMRTNAHQSGWDVRFYRDAWRLSVPMAYFVRWRRMCLDEARMSVGVPEFVERKIAQVVEKVPGAVVEVDGLESQSVFYDPFLVVSFAGEEYYIEVWGDDEKSFQR
jgi:hypothetical protein